MLKYALCTPKLGSLSTIQKLQEVHFTPSIDTEKYWGKPENTLSILPFLYAPAIKHISAMIEELKSFQWPCSNMPNPSTLTSLNIKLLREGTIGNILAHCPNLHTLAYHFYADADKNWPPAFLSCHDLATSLSHVKPTLTSLTLTGFFRDSYKLMGEPSVGMYTTLTVLPTFPVLEKLDMPFIILLD